MQEQFQDTEQQTNFIDIFRVKVWEITLRELLILQSIYTCEKVSDVESLVCAQPTPMLFFKVFLELGIQNMIPYISFDMMSIKHLLENKANVQYYNPKFPLFYLTDGRSAIDIALENNLLRSVTTMIKYIVEYQNDYVFNNLFIHLFVDLMNRGINVTPLLESKIFNNPFDYDEWPSIHQNTD